MKKLIFLILVLTGFLYSGCGQKSDDGQTMKDNKQNTPHTQTSTSEEKSNIGTSTTAPQIGTIWKQVEKKSEALGQLIKSGKFGHLHEAEEIVAILKALPERSTGLEKSKLENVNRIINELNTSSVKIDQLSHNKKMSELNAEYQTFNKLLSDLKSQYPSESFK